MRSTLHGLRLAYPALSLGLSLALAAAPASAGDPVVWNLTGCAQQHGSNLTLSICGGDCDFFSSASFVAPKQGTVILRADYSGEGITTWNVLHVTAGGKLIGFQQGSPCSPTPCNATLDPIVAHLLPGEVLSISLQDPETFCELGSSTYSFEGLSFEPDVGFITGAGALDGSALATANGPESNSFLGGGVALLNDLDGDGHGDVAASGLGSTGPDYLRFLSGATGAVLFDVLDPNGNKEFGQHVAAVGDLDGDGRFDVIAAADQGTAPALVLSGADGHVLHSIAPVPGDVGVAAVGAAGDLDGDGVPDVLVGSPLSDLGGLNSGAVRAYSGATGALLLSVPGLPGDEAGQGVASAGDVNGDGVPDLIVGVQNSDAFGLNKGSIRVHSGADGALIHELSPGSVPVDDWGELVAGAGDLDGDGVGDVIGGAPFGGLGGFVRAFSGATGALLLELIGGQYEGIGRSVCAAGDWDDDGRDDVAVGAGAGYVLIISGATHEVLEQIVLAGITDAVAPGMGGPAMCAGGTDVDGDGQLDLAVGLPSADFGSGFGNAGKVVFVSGDPADHVAPTLTGSGTLLPSTPLTLHIAGGDAFATVFLVVSPIKANLPFKGGLLVPSPLAIFVVGLNGAGAANLPGTWPPGIPSGASLWLQGWIPDSDGPFGLVATATLQIIAP